MLLEPNAMSASDYSLLSVKVAFKKIEVGKLERAEKKRQGINGSSGRQRVSPLGKVSVILFKPTSQHRSSTVTNDGQLPQWISTPLRRLAFHIRVEVVDVRNNLVTADVPTEPLTFLLIPLLPNVSLFLSAPFLP